MATRAESLGGRRALARTRSAARRARLLRVLAWLESEAFPITIAALYAIVLLVLMPGELVQDSWATLVAGREVAQHGLPHHETLTVMAHGVRWIDQQWLAQLFFYELFRIGGYRLILLTHVFLIASAFGLALVAARQRGASALSVFLVALVCFFVAPWGWQLRAQSFAPLLFVGVLWLLIEDGRRPSRRVFATLPLLAIWANLHGSVVLGAFLVALYGAVCVVGGKRGRFAGAALLALAPLAVACSPYGLSVAHYYRRLLVDPPFAKLVTEWTAPTPRAATALFYLLAFATVWAIGRWGRTLSVFERLALLLTLASALTATRNIVWFGLTALVLLPVLVDQTRSPGTKGAHPAVRVALGLASIAGLVATLAFVVVKPERWYEHEWHGPAAAAVSAAVTRDPAARVFASDRDADWLLWREPRLAGRMAFDIRFELDSRAQIRRLYNFFGRIGPHWEAVANGYRVIVLDRRAHERVRQSLLRQRQFGQTYIDPRLAILVRPG